MIVAFVARIRTYGYRNKTFSNRYKRFYLCCTSTDTDMATYMIQISFRLVRAT